MNHRVDGAELRASRLDRPANRVGVAHVDGPVGRATAGSLDFANESVDAFIALSPSQQDQPGGMGFGKRAGDPGEARVRIIVT